MTKIKKENPLWQVNQKNVRHKNRNVDKAAVEAYKVHTAELLGVNLIQSTC